jgi:putative oxidoreductase
MSGFGPVLLRLAVGTVFMSQGLLKLMPVSGGGVADTAALFASLGFPSPSAVAMTLGWVELAGGATLLLGAHTGWTSFALVLTTTVSAWTLHPPNALFMTWSPPRDQRLGFELDVVLVGALLCLMVTGAGSLSVDRARQRAVEREAAGLARLRRKSV